MAKSNGKIDYVLLSKKGMQKGRLYGFQENIDFTTVSSNPEFQIAKFNGNLNN